MRVFLRMGEEIRGGDSVGTQWETCGKNRRQGLGTKGFAQKKVLSLVLCVAMLLSVMVMGTGAAFTDQDEIQNAEAVDMTSALGIIDGYEDGSFQPAENIERGEAAKMISAMLNGGRDSVQETTESSYNDVLGSVDAWANKYIEYCTARGIVSGVGGDRFAPASNVTGTQLAKMLLVSLGYDSVKEGYQDNAMWSVNVNTDAVAAGLYAGIETIDMSAPLSRDNAAQMIWNALQAKTVVYLTDSTGAIEFQSTTLLDKVYGARVDTGIMEGIRYNQDTKNYTYTIQPVDSSAADNGTAYTVESTTDYSDLFAMNVTVLHKDDSAMMIRVNEGGTVVEGVVGDIGGVGNNYYNTITVNGQKYTLDNVAKNWDAVWNITCGYNQYNELGSGRWHDGPDVREQYSFRAIDQDGGGDIDVIVVYPYVVLKTDTVLSDSFNANVITRHDANMTVVSSAQDSDLIDDLGLNYSNTVEYADVIVNGTIARDGYVMATPAQYTAQRVDTYTVLDIQSDVAKKLQSEDMLITLGGTQYDGNLLEQIDAFKQISLNKEYSFVEVNGYLFIMDGTGIVPAVDQYAVVTKTANQSEGADKTYQTDLLKTDGTTVRVDVSDVDNDSWYSAPVVGSLYTYEVNDAGYYELTAVPAGSTRPADSEFDVQQAYKTGATLNDDFWHFRPVNLGVPYMYGTNSAGGYFEDLSSDQTYNIEDDAIIFVYNYMTNEYNVVKGSDLENNNETWQIRWAFTGATEKVFGNATVDLGYVAVANDPDEVTVYAYVDGDAVRTVNEEGKYSISVDVILNNGEKATLTTDDSVKQDGAKFQRLYACLEAGDYFKLIVGENNTLIDIKEYWVGDTADVTSVLYNSMITLDGTQYFVTSDTVFIPVSGEADSIADIQRGQEVTFVVADDDSHELLMIGY